MTNQMS
jgi:hypothetical protein